MVKIPTAWSTNTTKNADAVRYSSATALYSSPTVYYTSSTVGKNELNKPATAWTQSTKTPAAWQHNPAFSLNQYVYDSATIPYDSTSRTYDGVNGAQQSTGTAPATAWTVIS